LFNNLNIKVQGDLRGVSLNLLVHQSSDFVRINPINMPISGEGSRHAGVLNVPTSPKDKNQQDALIIFNLFK